ncbi:hypothetical protein [Bradyrhizobium sp. USDA 4451]
MALTIPTRLPGRATPKVAGDWLMPDDQWDHPELSNAEAIKLMDGWLDLEILKPYDYRMAITYFMMAQGDFSDELQLQKFEIGKDAYWKPFVAYLFGFDESSVQRKYELDASITWKSSARS